MQLLEQNGRQLNVSGVLRQLGVSRSGYNAWKKKKPSNQEIRRNQIKEKICDIYDKSKQNYGAPKITKTLQSEGECISERTVGKYMCSMGIKAQWIKPYTVTTIDSNFSSEYKNILNEEFNPDSPDAVWCSDITYIWTLEGFVYLTSIMDLFSRKIISWVLSDTLETKWVIKTINKAKKARNISKPLIMHSDRGVQFTSVDYMKATNGFTCSYSKKAYPWDNACIESFHSLLKREWINRFRITDYNHAHRLIFEYIDAFYNTVRIHSYCDYMSPVKYEKEYWNKLRKLEIKTA